MTTNQTIRLLTLVTLLSEGLTRAQVSYQSETIGQPRQAVAVVVPVTVKPRYIPPIDPRIAYAGLYARQQAYDEMRPLFRSLLPKSVTALISLAWINQR